MKIIVIVSLLLVAAPARAQSLAPSLALLAGSGADLVTTLHALHTVPGATEGNPMLSHGGDAGLVAVKLGTTAALVFAVHRLMPTHPVLARCLGYGGGLALMGVAARNARLK